MSTSIGTETPDWSDASASSACGEAHGGYSKVAQPLGIGLGQSMHEVIPREDPNSGKYYDPAGILSLFWSSPSGCCFGGIGWLVVAIEKPDRKIKPDFA